MANLHRRGLIAPDQTGAGINCQPCGKVIDSSGQSNNQLYAIGPLLKAVLLESVAVPELKGQAEELAHLICTEQQAIV
jgi:hydroxyacylglutathione hydrolase